MSIISISQQKKRVQVSGFELDNRVIFEYFNNLQTAERDTQFLKAINIGVLALMEDRLSTFLSKTSNELGTELESLKLIFDMKQEVFQKSSLKGALAEEDIAEFLSQLVQDSNLKDNIILTGTTTGAIHNNKTGDIVCHVDGRDDLKIIIECKFDKSIRLGDIKDKDIFTNKSDTAWSQLIEAQANRVGKVSIIVLDASSIDGALFRSVQNVKFIPQVGFIVVVDSQKGDYSNLAISYTLSRDLALNARNVEFDKDLMAILINRIIKDIHDIASIKKLVKANITNNIKILEQLEKSILMMNFNKKFLERFLTNGTLTKKELLDFYFGDEVKSEFKLIEKDINALCDI